MDGRARKRFGGIMSSPDLITQLEPEQVIVVGTNMLGNHVGGAACQAQEIFGLQDGCHEGLSGQTYALPTIGIDWKPLFVYQIGEAVERFLCFAKWNPNLTFLVTKIGCGIAGHSEDHIKPLFQYAPANVVLPEGWS
jgi:hypothetical protein